MKELNVAVTGASGFVGSYVLSALSKFPVKITVVTRKASNINNAGEDLQIVEFDIAGADSNSFELLGRPDVLVHLAWGGLPNYDSNHHLDEELPAQFGFLSQLISDGLSSLIVSGTCYEYGMKTGCLTEDMETAPNNPYGQAKDSLRKQLESLKQNFSYSLTWTRLFYIFGEGQSKNSLLPQLERAVAAGDKSFRMSGGEQIRDYTPVELVGSILAALAFNQTDAGILNVCSGEPKSIRDLVSDWIGKNGWQIDLELGYYPYSPHEPMEFWGDTRKLDKYMQSLPTGGGIDPNE